MFFFHDTVHTVLLVFSTSTLHYQIYTSSISPLVPVSAFIIPTGPFHDVLLSMLLLDCKSGVQDSQPFCIIRALEVQGASGP